MCTNDVIKYFVNYWSVTETITVSDDNTIRASLNPCLQRTPDISQIILPPITQGRQPQRAR